jgi:hypothetical protein
MNLHSPLVIILIVCVVLWLLAYPRAGGYNAGWGYAPFGGVGLIVLIVVLLLLFGCTSALAGPEASAKYAAAITAADTKYAASMTACEAKDLTKPEHRAACKQAAASARIKAKTAAKRQLRLDKAADAPVHKPYVTERPAA